MGNASLGAASEPREPYVGCTGDTGWLDSNYSEAVFDVYEIGEMLGSGAFAQVRACWPIDKTPSSRDEYAIKIVDTQSEVFMQASSYISAKQEANVLKGLSNPHIVDLVDVFLKERWLFLVMEVYAGGELFAALSNPDVSVTEVTVAAVGRQLLGALDYLHGQDVVHRDVKAENIVLSSNPAETGRWHIKLVDFGLAIRCEQPTCMFQLCRDQDVPLERLTCGTPYYCAPEAWQADYSPKVDIWAAGIVLYLALHGLYPFRDNDIDRLESIICDPEMLPTFRPADTKACLDYEVSKGAREALSLLLTKDQDERPCAEEMMRDLWIQGISGRWGLRRGRSNSSFGSSAEWEHSDSSDDDSPHRTGAGAAGAAGLLRREIPAPIRVKAGRAARRPDVDPNMEHARTKALQGLQRRASLGHQKGTSRSHSVASVWSPSHVHKSRELAAESLDNSSARGHTARLSCRNGDGSSSDGDGDGDGDGGCSDSDPSTQPSYFSACGGC